MQDNTALRQALDAYDCVYCLFVFDTQILATLSPGSARRVEFMLESVRQLHCALAAQNGGLVCVRGASTHEVPRLALELNCAAVFANHDYEPAAVSRDENIRIGLEQIGVAFKTFKDVVVFEKNEVLTQVGKPFTVFTPYKNAWLKRLESLRPDEPGHEPRWERLAAPPHSSDSPNLAHLGFAPTNLKELGILPGNAGAEKLFAAFEPRMDRYADARDFPAVRGVSYLSVHNRFGTCSIRELVRRARLRSSSGATTWLSELIWREFYFQILWHHPHVVSGCFKPRYDAIPWQNDERLFAAWCEGRTGYPIVDAGMRQLNRTGYMHNRLRMIVASFLTKDLLIDWRWGERYFAEHLIDHDLAANNGGWQWAASTGCDAQPYFRIFNPVSQSERFDAKGAFIRRYLPELETVPDKLIHAPWRLSAAEQTHIGIIIGKHYPLPIVDHAARRAVALRMFDQAGT